MTDYKLIADLRQVSRLITYRAHLDERDAIIVNEAANALERGGSSPYRWRYTSQTITFIAGVAVASVLAGTGGGAMLLGFVTGMMM